MIHTEERKIKKCSVEEVSKEFLDLYYGAAEHRKDILLIYDGGQLKTLLAYENWRSFGDEQQLEFYVQNSNNNYIGHTEESAKEIFRLYPEWYYLIVSLSAGKGRFVTGIGSCGNMIYSKVHDILTVSGVNVYRVKIPYSSDIKEMLIKYPLPKQKV